MRGRCLAFTYESDSLNSFLLNKGPSDLQPSLLHVENCPRDASDSIIPENSIYPKKIRKECVRSLP